MTFAGERGAAATAGLIVLVLILVPVAGLHLAGPVGLSVYAVNVVGQVMCFALLAMSVDLMWGGAGVLSLGHGLFFALGGYIAAMHLLRTAFAKTHVLPDFLQFMGQSAFPGYWRLFDSLPLTLLAILLVLGTPDSLPKHDGGRAFSLAYLCAERLPLTICSPGAAGVTACLCGDPEGERVDAAVGFAGGDVGGPGERAAAVHHPVHARHVRAPACEARAFQAR